jgi:hypothetical protein
MIDPRPVYYLLPISSLEPAESATSWLGRIVQNYASPRSEYSPADPKPFITTPYSDTTITDVTAILRSCTSSEVKARLSSLASLAHSNTPNDDLDISTQSIRFIKLDNYPTIFRALRQSPEVQQHLAHSLRPGGSPAYMIVGVAIWTDARFTKGQTTAKATTADIKAPVTAAIAATTGIVLPQSDVEVSGSSTATTSNQISGLSQGSSIFAIQYRAVRRRLRSVLNDFDPSLEDYGPRTASSFVFSGHAESTGTAEKEAQSETKLDLGLDDDDVDWTDLLDDGPEVEDFDKFSFAFDNE